MSSVCTTEWTSDRSAEAAAAFFFPSASFQISEVLIVAQVG
jgi:hypothetical protein